MPRSPWSTTRCSPAATTCRMPVRTTRKICWSSTARRWPIASSPTSTRFSLATRPPRFLRQNRDMAGRHRAALIAGSLLSAGAVLPPVAALADRRLSLHMLLEMLLLALVVPLFAYGAGALRRVPLAARVHPVIGIVALNVVLFGSQLPTVMDLASKNPLVQEATLVAFIGGAFLFWWPIVRPGGLSPIAKIGYLMVAGVPPTLPGITLALCHPHAGGRQGDRLLMPWPVRPDRLVPADHRVSHHHHRAGAGDQEPGRAAQGNGHRRGRALHHRPGCHHGQRGPRRLPGRHRPAELLQVDAGSQISGQGYAQRELGSG